MGKHRYARRAVRIAQDVHLREFSSILHRHPAHSTLCSASSLFWIKFEVDDHPAGRCPGLDAQDFAASQNFVKFLWFRHC
jgi:hypothetical protein